MMKKSFLKNGGLIVLIIFLGLISCQIYYHITNSANASLIVDSYDKNLKELAILYMNNKKVDTVNFNEYYPYKGRCDFSWGRNKIEIRGIENKSINYETTINYIGLYSWNVIQYRSDGISRKKYYIQPRFR